MSFFVKIVFLACVLVVAAKVSNLFFFFITPIYFYIRSPEDVMLERFTGAMKKQTNCNIPKLIFFSRNFLFLANNGRRETRNVH